MGDIDSVYIFESGSFHLFWSLRPQLRISKSPWICGPLVLQLLLSNVDSLARTRTVTTLDLGLHHCAQHLDVGGGIDSYVLQEEVAWHDMALVTAWTDNIIGVHHLGYLPWVCGDRPVAAATHLTTIK